jgi:BON domain
MQNPKLDRLTRLIGAASLLVAFGLMVVSCKSKPAVDDATLTSNLQARIESDQALATQPVQASVSGGVATLNGSVDSDAHRSLASEDAAQVAGVRTVVNNLTVQASTAVLSVPPPPAIAPMAPAKKPSAALPAQHPPQPAPIERSASAPPPAPEPAPVQAEAAPSAPTPPPPPPAPVVHTITLASGTTIPVRITQTLDSATTQTGDKFSGVLASDIVLEGVVVLREGTPISGHVDEAKDATHFKGSSALTISLTAIDRKGEHLIVNTDQFTKQGQGRGTNTAEKVGGGAAVGAILGGILGGGKGAAIGAAAGGGVGAGAQAATRGQQVQIPSETLVRFRLTDPITVRVAGPPANENPTAALEHRSDQ